MLLSEVNMQSLQRIGSRLGIARELLAFLWKKKLWWLLLIVVFLLLLGIILVFGQSSALAPFIYSLF
jgi:hypothetical protein